MKTHIFLSLAFVTLSSLTWANDYHQRTFKDQFKYIANQINSKLLGFADNQGQTLTSGFSRTQKSWKRMDREISKLVEETHIKDFTATGYKEEFDLTVNGIAGSASSVAVLVDGQASFKKRKEMIQAAKHSISLMVWAIYDDLTGEIHSKWLLDKLKTDPQVRIRIIVDRLTALGDHHFAELRRLKEESNGRIQTIFWKSKRYRANGSHRKIFVVDEEKVIMGGLNIGDVYSHLNPEVPGWRDTDVYMEGSVGKAAAFVFARVWNEQIKNNKLNLEEMPVPELALAEGGIPVTVVDHSPGVKGQKADYNILLAYAKLIRDAKVSVDIENAYFIFNPVIRRVLQEAVARGVRVRVLTNSDESVDEPVVSVPILKSAREAFEMGVEVYLRKGTTLHSKMMVIDKKISLIGSDNLHPRSQRFEGETMAVIFDEHTAQVFTEVFERDLVHARKVEVKEDIKVKQTLLSRVVSLLFYDHL